MQRWVRAVRDDSPCQAEAIFVVVVDDRNEKLQVATHLDCLDWPEVAI